MHKRTYLDAKKKKIKKKIKIIIIEIGQHLAILTSGLIAHILVKEKGI